MTSLISALAWVAAIAAVGGFVDFIIGSRGQAVVRNRLEEYWIRFSYVKPANAGRSEALFAAEIIDNIFELRNANRQILIFFIVSIGVFSYYIALYSLFPTIAQGYYHLFFISLETCCYAYILLYFGILITMAFARFAAKTLPNNAYLNIIYFFILFVFQTFMINIGSSIISVVSSFINLIGLNIISLVPVEYLQMTSIPFSYESLKDMPKANRNFIENAVGIFGVFLDAVVDYKNYVPSLKFRLWPVRFIQTFPDYFVHYTVSLLINLLRFSIAAIFLSSVLLRVFHDFIEIVWLRMTEQKSPIFTFLFGSLAAAAKFIEGLFKLSS